jgi:UDP-glucuronate 4-epimerase
MAPYKFTQAIMRDQPITIYNHGRHQRDFTFIDDIVAGTLAALRGQQFVTHPTTPPFKVYNIGYGQPTALMDFIELLEQALGKPARKQFVEAQPGDVDNTWADTRALATEVGYQPKVPLTEGILRWVDWYRRYHA